VQEVPLEHTRRYGIVDGKAIEDRLTQVERIVEKPAPEVAPSRIGVAGRYILTPAIFRHLKQLGSGAGGEIQLTDGIAALMADEAVYAYKYQGKRYDCGSKEGFLLATVELALQHSEVGPAFREYLQQLQIQ
jgi:UTP--glucose-1-phosphate uridylyltransferase